MSYSTKEARFTIARQAADIATMMASQFQKLALQLGHGSVHSTSARGDVSEPVEGDAVFLYEYVAPHNDTDLKFLDDVHKLKAFVEAIIALEKLEESP